MKNSYTWQARILPAVAFMLPFFVELNYLLRLLNVGFTWPTVISNLVMAMAIVVLSNFCRYKGKKKETDLFVKWGGAPTTRFLRYSNNEYNTYNKNKVKSYWRNMVYDIPIPTSKEEISNPQKADSAYESFVDRLRADFRSSKLFPLIHAENKNYGMWRNLYGIKPISICICFILIICNVIMTIYIPTFMNTQTCCVISGILLLVVSFWFFIVTESRVKQAAESYAERLFESCYANRVHLKEGLGEENDTTDTTTD